MLTFVYFVCVLNVIDNFAYLYQLFKPLTQGMQRDTEDWEDVIVVFSQVENVRISNIGSHVGSHLVYGGLVHNLLGSL
jgi:hypothetical protein